MTTLFLEPFDVWLFRDGRPFTAGQQFRASSRFPPSPLVVQGALRAYHLLAHTRVPPWDERAVTEAVGGPDDWGRLRLAGPLLARWTGTEQVEVLLPPPADAVVRGDRLQRLPTPQEPPSWLVLHSPTPRLFPLWESAELESEKANQRLWLRLADFPAYCRGETVPGVPQEELWSEEVRIGIAQDTSRRTTREGLYYEAHYVRPAPGVGLLVSFTGLDWPHQEGILALGGERRSARFVALPEFALSAPPDPLPERFALYFLTPAVFDQGWLPADWSAFFEGPVRLVAAALERAETVGGFDMARGTERPAHRAVPAGSVYYFQAEGTARLRHEREHPAVTISDWGREIGFGTVAIGGW
ncbi:MAG: CRISPR-associated protein Cmr3 [Thermomicrobium sp.]|nr:CRISPR-associated protein Cmr3 [Thermomicrobium sp.]